MNRSHGACERDSRLYGIWKTMMHRCYDPKREKYKDYGGRGITVCNEWHYPNSFINWSYTHGYQDGLQIDRVDNDQGYSPDNCRWVTAKENSRNRRNENYIKKQDALDALGKQPEVWCWEDNLMRKQWECDKAAIESVSPTDVRPVVRGKWIKVGGFCTPGGDPVWECSECRKGRHVYGIEHGTYGADISDGQWVACPNCGADMRGDAE